MKRYPAIQMTAMAALLLLGVSCTLWQHPRVADTEMVPDTFRVTSPCIDRFMEEVEYTDDDYTVSRILEYPGGGPGDADIPPTVRLQWDKAGAEKVRVQEYPDSAWGWDYPASADSSFVDIYDLVPGRDYMYFVLGARGDTISRGRFYTVGTLHQAYLRHRVRNARDLGGWKTQDGRIVGYRKLYRSGKIVGEDGTSVYINRDGIEDARALGIGAELDLREEDVVPEFSPLGPGVAFCAPGFPLGGSTMLGKYQDGVARSFHFIVRSLHEGRGVIFHCSAGRDRTGTMAALLLGVLGVSEWDIGKEYELTYFAPRGYSMGREAEVYRHTRDGIRNSCRYIRKNYGSPEGSFQQACENYLQAIGVSEREIEDFKNLVLQ
jgi:protein-tyrosine phosphatase